MTYTTQCSGYEAGRGYTTGGNGGMSLLETWRGAWQPGVIYKRGDMVSHQCKIYIKACDDCSTTEPPASPWGLFVDLAACGQGGGTARTPELLAGLGAPGGGGLDGDLYLDNATGDLYVKKNGAWVAAGNLRGPAGPAGPAGADGGVSEERVRQLIAEDMASHRAACHTLEVITDGLVTAEAGWTVDAQEFRRIGGTHTVFVRLTRTGGNLTGFALGELGENQQPESGNIVPDLLIATIDTGWTPAETYVAYASTAYGDGGVRVHADGRVFLTQWQVANTIQDGHNLRFEFTFLRETPCEAGGA